MQASPRDPATVEVFISYRRGKRTDDGRRRQTSGEAHHLRDLLVESGLDVFLDIADIRGGDDWWAEILAAIAGERLAVGVVLMVPSWYQDFVDDPKWSQYDEAADERPDAVAWEEVRRLQAEAQRRLDEAELGTYDGPPLVLIPVVVRDAEDGNVVPELPPEGTPGFAALERVRERFEHRNYRWIPPEHAHRFDRVVADVYEAVRRSTAYTPIDRRLRVSAACTPPQPLHRLRFDDDARRRFTHYAERIGEAHHRHDLETILGQEALLRHDHPTALQRLASARKLAPPPPRPGDPPELAGPEATPGASYRAALWHAHAVNLFVLTSFDGQRPRRLPITDAGRLLSALAEVVAIEVQQLRVRPVTSEDQARADRDSAAYVIETTFLLLWLLWHDFFVVRNVLPADVAAAGDPGFERRLGDLYALLAQLRNEGAPGRLRESHEFLAQHRHLEGLPPQLSDPRALDGWMTAWASGRLPAFLTRWPL